jgi:hypothetical protein
MDETPLARYVLEILAMSPPLSSVLPNPVLWRLWADNHERVAEAMTETGREDLADKFREVASRLREMAEREETANEPGRSAAPRAG